ncbi:MAG: hypothetical protein ACRAVC_00560 [Trichormus sp.]
MEEAGGREDKGDKGDKERSLSGGNLRSELRGDKGKFTSLTPLHPYTPTPLHPYTPTPLHPYTPTQDFLEVLEEY